MHAILTTMGTAGDVLPFVAVGAALRAAGHRATVVAPQAFEPLARREGLAFDPLFSRQEHEELMGHPDFWHPFKGPGMAARWAARFTGRQYELLSRLARDEDSVLVINPAILVARVVQEKLGRPVAILLLQPWMIPSNSRPPVMPSGLTLPRWAPRPIKHLYWRAVYAIGDALVLRPLNQVRAEQGLPPIRRALDWFAWPQLVLGMFPNWYGHPQPDWPPQLRLCGFPLYDGAADDSLPAELARFLDGGEPPVAITFGTGMIHAPAMYHDALEACRRLGRRAVVVTRHAAQLPAPLPTFALHVPFAPFRKLFPHCAAVVHHGGIGTIAECLAGGIPQLVLPISWDQFDNAVRVRELRAGDWIAPRRRSPRRLADILLRVMSDRQAGRVPPLLPRSPADDPLQTACRHLESIVTSCPLFTSSGSPVAAVDLSAAPRR